MTRTESTSSTQVLKKTQPTRENRTATRVLRVKSLGRASDQQL
jgi:hypothetical protein